MPPPQIGSSAHFVESHDTLFIKLLNLSSGNLVESCKKVKVSL